MSGLPRCHVARPDDDDLTGVVTHLAPLTTRHGSQVRDPNEPEVRWLLEAGVRAMREGFLDRSCEETGPVAYSHANGLFDTLPMDRVMRCFKELCAEAGVDPGSANKARLIRRWGFAANYQLDLIAYVFRPALLCYHLTSTMNHIAGTWGTLSMGQLVDDLDPSDAIPGDQDSIYRLQQVVRLMFPSDPQIQRFSHDLHVIETRYWGQFYAFFAEACALPPPSVAFTDIAAMMQLITTSRMQQYRHLGSVQLSQDGTPIAVLLMRAAAADAFGIPWSELASRRPGAGTSPPVITVSPIPDAALPQGG